MTNAMRYTVSIDVPQIDDGLRFYRDALGMREIARPIPSYAMLQCGESQIGIFEKAAGTRPAKGCDALRSYDRHWTPVHLDFHVADFDAVLEQALGAGATCEQRFEGGARPATAFCSDPFGNGFCIIAV